MVDAIQGACYIAREHIKEAAALKKTALLALLLCLVCLMAGAEELVLSFVGDCSIGEMASAAGRPGTYTHTVDEKGPDWPFSLVREYLEGDDFTFANLEVVFTQYKKHVNKRIPLRADPKYAQVLLHSGIDAVNTANNHCMDFYEKGYLETIQTLDALPLPRFGTTQMREDAAHDRLLLTSVKDMLIGAVGVSYPQEKDAPAIISRVQKLKDQGARLVIVSLHWGKELTKQPQAWQHRLARRLIDGGADVIWGHHPHILQPIHVYQGKPIFYSTGNFTFGSMSKVDPDTGIFQLKYSLADDGQPRLSQINVIPCRTQGKGDYRPIPLTDEKDIQTLYKKLSHTRQIKGMENPPEAFFTSGVWVIE